MFGRKKREQRDLRVAQLTAEVAGEIAADRPEYDNIIYAIRDISSRVSPDENGKKNKYLELICKSAKPEEETKRALIFPFLLALGYDCLDEYIVSGERSIEIPGKKKPGKVDYSIVAKDGKKPDKKPQDHSDILFEAKACNVNFTPKGLKLNHDQLAGYFDNTEEACIGILSNGIEYRFYGCDPDAAAEGKHIMAKEPFIFFDLSKPESINTISSSIVYLTHDNFDPTRVSEYTDTLKSAFTARMKNTTISRKSIDALRGDVGNTDLINDETFVAWMGEAIVQNAESGTVTIGAPEEVVPVEVSPESTSDEEVAEPESIAADEVEEA